MTVLLSDMLEIADSFSPVDADGTEADIDGEPNDFVDLSFDRKRVESG